MPSALTLALRKRAAQWAAFNKWEQDRVIVDTPDLATRVAWYASAFELTSKLTASVKEPDKREKAERVRKLHQCLARLTRH